MYGTSLAVLCFIPVYTSLPAFYLPSWQPIDSSAPSGLRAELNGYDLATLRDGILLPTHPDGSVPTLPAPQSSLIEGLEAPTPVFNRFDPVIHPNHAKDSLDNNLLNDHYVFGTNESLTSKLFILNYPNWTANINGDPQPLKTSPEGLATVVIPSSTVDIRLSFESTPVRYVSWAITGFGLLIVIVVVWRGWWPTQRAGAFVQTLLSRSDAIALMLVFVVYSITSGYLRLDAEIFQLGAPHTLTNITPLKTQFGGITLAGYVLTVDTVQPGKDFTIRLFWQADKPISDNEQSEVQLINVQNAQGVITLDHRHPGGVPTSRWPTDQKSYVEDDFVFSIAPDAPAGKYSIQVALGACQASPLLPCEEVADAKSRLVIPDVTIKVQR